jgi:hypothetical protein
MSYSHADQSWAAWLHKSLESYRVPKRLVGKQGLHGTVPARLRPIFRDREELSSASDLSVKIRDALAASESLLVICSPAAARSKWVNEEIRFFHSLGGTRVYCLIVEGDPHSSDPQKQCFPAALFECGDDHLIEPLAADIRKQADGKSLAMAKLVAGLAGLRLDELLQREKQRKIKRRLVAGLAMTVAVALVISSIQSRVAEKQARLAQASARASAENMLAGFLTESERLEDIADLETRKAFGEVLNGYLAQLNPHDLTIESKRQLGVALSHRGVILYEEQQFAQAMDVFRHARKVFQLLRNESQRDGQLMFELSQVEYWIGQVYLDLGQMEAAAISFNAYAEVSEALHEMQPDNSKWAMEVCYAHSNLGNLERRRIPSDPDRVLQHFTSALEYNEIAARQNPVYERELAESLAFMADAWLDICDLDQAMAYRRRAVDQAERHYRLNPASNKSKQDYAYALFGVAGVEVKTGKLGAALESLQQSLALQTELVEEDSGNLKKRWNLLRKSATQARYLELSGELDESWSLSLALESRMRELLELDQDHRIDNNIDYGVFLRDFACRAYRKKEYKMASRLLAESIQILTDIVQQYPDNRQGLYELALAYFYDWQQNNATLTNDSVVAWLARFQDASNLRSCLELDIASRQALIAEEYAKARDLASLLIERGYHEPEFKRFCFEYGLCLGETNLRIVQ